MAKCVHCKNETNKFTLIEGIGKIAVCQNCMKANDVSIKLLEKLRGESSKEKSEEGK